MSGLTVGELYREACETLSGAGINNPRLDARILLGAVVDGGEAAVFGYPERPVASADVRRARDLVAKRASRLPLSQVLGRKEFWSLDFEVTGDTLTPRPDTETLIDAVLAWIAERKLTAPRILDLGTGSGCILLTLLHALPGARGVGIDCSTAALAIAKRNAVRLAMSGRADFVKGDWCAGAAGPFDVVVSNPPYIPTGDIGGLDPEVARYEPLVALDGGLDGLDAYRTLARSVQAVLAPGGLFALEVGAGQAAAVVRMFGDAGFDGVSTYADLSGLDRCVLGTAPKCEKP